ncbi:MAG: hypothetical protein K0Q76_3581 [Panacagrimonas sp.]|nr:hypothetical protein [Panacagrimonas sp.]MCC2658473.1 hypothetical protein [Panacagrimonas sp.]
MSTGTGIRALARSGVLAVSLFAGCSTTPVTPPTEFPKPVLRRIPVSMGLYMDDAFRNYVHHDKPEKGAKQDVSVGPASRVLFDEFLAAQFTRLQPVTAAPSGQMIAPGVEAVLQPVVQDVQISSPRTEKDPFHEAWIKYRLRLLTPWGQEIAAWELAAYGKHRGSMMGGTNAALTAAVRDAMRDAAAGMALIFRDGNALRARIAAASPQPAPATATP